MNVTMWAAVRRRLMLGFAEMIDGGLNGWLAIGILEVFLWGPGMEICMCSTPSDVFVCLSGHAEHAAMSATEG